MTVTRTDVAFVMAVCLGALLMLSVVLAGQDESIDARMAAYGKSK